MKQTNFLMKISFCIIKTPFPIDEHDYTIFFTKVGTEYLDTSIKKEREFFEIVGFLKKIGYIEIDDLSFGFVGTNRTKKMTKEELIQYFRSIGMTYGNKFEKNMAYEMEQMKKLINPQSASSILKDFINELKKESAIEGKLKNIINSPTPEQLSSVPKFGEEIELSFYLILDFLYNEDKAEFQIDLNGSFLQEKQNIRRYRNIVKVISEKFERFEKEDSMDDGLYFRSKKTKGDIMNEISFLYEVVVDLVKHKKNTKASGEAFEKVEFYFDLFDIREKVNPNERIVIINNDAIDYVKMIDLSEAIKESSKKQELKTIEFFEVEETCKELKEQLNKRMLIFAENEEFESASRLKNDIKIIEDKIGFFKENNLKEKKISIDMFHDHFNLK